MKHEHGVASVSTGEDQRRTRRQRALRAAKVVLSDWTMIDCTIRDQTEEGARLTFAAPTSLPEEFRLSTTLAHKVRPVRLLWQRGLNAGVAFAGPEEDEKHRRP